MSDPAPAPVEVDPARFRQVLARFATGVTIITAISNGEPVGMSANSFTSLSLDPPLVLFCAAESSTTYPRIRGARRFCVNVLAEQQQDVAQLFAVRGADRFERAEWHPGLTGSPVLEGVLAYLECEIETEHVAGDHVIVVGRVLDLGSSTERRPLLFFDGGYGIERPVADGA
jgi:flavin reductase (DIM6/NTAB) family NADH-FMN oxidoreductase RutF